MTRERVYKRNTVLHLVRLIFFPSATLQDVLKSDKGKFIADDKEISLSCLALTDSSGSRIDIEDEDSWDYR